MASNDEAAAPEWGAAASLEHRVDHWLPGQSTSRRSDVAPLPAI